MTKIWWWICDWPSHRLDASSGYTTVLHCWPAATNHRTCPCSPWSFPLHPDHTALARKLPEKEESYLLIFKKKKKRMLLNDLRFWFGNYIVSFHDINLLMTIKQYDGLWTYNYLIFNSGRSGSVTSLISMVKAWALPRWRITMILWVTAETHQVNICSCRLFQPFRVLSRCRLWTLACAILFEIFWFNVMTNAVVFIYIYIYKINLQFLWSLYWKKKYHNNRRFVVYCAWMRKCYAIP